MYFSDRVVAYFSGESSTGAAAIAPQRRDSPSITRRGVFLFLFFPSWQDEKICATGSFISTSYTFAHLRRKILHLEVPDPLYYPLQTFVRPRSILLSHITLCCPTVFLCFSQQYLSNCLNSIFRLLPDLRAPCRSRRAVYWPCPALPRMLLLWPPAPTSQKCKVVAANKLFQYIQWHIVQ